MSTLLDPLFTGSLWSKIRFFYEHALDQGTLVATSQVSGYEVENLYSMFEVNLWKATSTADQYHTFDAGSGKTYTADYDVIHGHNLHTAGATVVLQYSNDNFSSDIHDVYTAFSPDSDGTILKRFDSISSRYWRRKITGQTVPPFMAIGIWGSETELDYASSDFDPHAYTDKANVNISDTGYLLGIHDKYQERNIAISFEDAESELYDQITAWNDFVGLGNFFIAWELSLHTSDVWLVHSDPAFKNPLTQGGRFRNINLSLKGRKA